jgi:hypothetical protein
MKLGKVSFVAAVFGLFLSASAFADTLTGAITYKDADDNIIIKSGKIDFDAADVANLRMRIQDRLDNSPAKIKVVKLETENRTIVLAAFHDVANLPEDTSLIVKASLLEGKNGKLLYGDVFTRSCEKGYADGMSDEDSALDRLMYAVRERKGCDLEYRGGILLSTVQAQSDTQGAH